jgi:hypothetical protein
LKVFSAVTEKKTSFAEKNKRKRNVSYASPGLPMMAKRLLTKPLTWPSRQSSTISVKRHAAK